MLRFWMSRAALAACLIVLIVPAYGAGGKKDDDVEQVSGKGRIDWTSGAIYATGLGAVPRGENNDAVAYLKGREYANLDAMKNLLMTIKHVHIDAHSTGSDFVTTSAVIRAEVEGLLKGPQIISERKIKIGRDTMVEVTVCTHMYGDKSVASVFLPEEIKRQHETTPEPPAEVQQEVQHNVRPEITPAPDNGPHYTSLIIDARGFRVTRDLAPKINRRDGSEVWGTVNVDPDWAIEHGIVIYTHTMADARELARCGNRPLILHAIGGANSPAGADVILSDEDASRLMRFNARDGFLNHYNVIFLVDPLH